jgi:hypothetical protein
MTISEAAGLELGGPGDRLLAEGRAGNSNCLVVDTGQAVRIALAEDRRLQAAGPCRVIGAQSYGGLSVMRSGALKEVVRLTLWFSRSSCRWSRSKHDYWTLELLARNRARTICASSH